MDVHLGMLRADGTFNFGERGLDLPRIGMVKDTTHTVLNSAPPAKTVRDWPSEPEYRISDFSWKPAPWGMTSVDTKLPDYDFKSTYRDSGLLDGVAPEFHNIVRAVASEQKFRSLEVPIFRSKSSNEIDVAKMMQEVNNRIERQNRIERSILMDNLKIREKPTIEQSYKMRSDCEGQGFAEIHRQSGDSLHTFQSGLNAHIDIGSNHSKFPKLYINKYGKDNQGNPIDTRIKDLDGVWP